MKLTEWTTIDCKNCNGKGFNHIHCREWDRPCAKCDGMGKVRIKMEDIRPLDEHKDKLTY